MSISYETDVVLLHLKDQSEIGTGRGQAQLKNSTDC